MEQVLDRYFDKASRVLHAIENEQMRILLQKRDVCDVCFVHQQLHPCWTSRRIQNQSSHNFLVGNSIDHKANGMIHLAQPHLINQILEDLQLDVNDVKAKSKLAASSKLLSRRQTDSKDFV